MRTALAVALVAVLLVSGCGGSSTSPTPVPPAPTSIAGNWTGTVAFTPVGGGTRQSVSTAAAFTQAGGNVSGQIDLTGGPTIILNGQMTADALAASGQYSGTTPGCTGTAQITGAVSAGVLRFSIPTFASSSCSIFTSADFTLSR